jgi:hypothetical protein
VLYTSLHSFSLSLSLTKAKNAKGYMLLQEKSPLCMLPAPLNIFPTLLAPFHFLRIFSAQSEGRKLKKDEIQEAKRQALRVQIWNAGPAGSENNSNSSIAISPTQQLQTPQSSSAYSSVASPQLYVISLAGSLSDDIIKFVHLFLHFTFLCFSLSPSVSSSLPLTTLPLPSP